MMGTQGVRNMFVNNPDEIVTSVVRSRGVPAAGASHAFRSVALGRTACYDAAVPVTSLEDLAFFLPLEAAVLALAGGGGGP